MPRTLRTCTRVALGLALAAAWAADAAAVAVDWVVVGDPGNACETQPQGCFGAVAAAYQISATEVTNAQYTEFLNAVAASDPGGLYHPSMANAGAGFGGINRSGSPGSYVYAAAAGREDMPVNHVSFYDALRFANWLHNGQPAGAQGPSTTEGGSYTISAQGIADNSILRNAGATTVLPSEDEWYKAAYHDGTGYLAFPTGGAAPTACADAAVAQSGANCENAVGAGTGGLTPVGSYSGSASPYGTLDQGGNLWEWNESVLSGDFRGLRGGAFNHAVDFLAASHRSLNDPLAETNNIGFRVALLPEPGASLLLAAGLLGLGLCRAGRSA